MPVDISAWLRDIPNNSVCARETPVELNRAKRETIARKRRRDPLTLPDLPLSINLRQDSLDQAATPRAKRLRVDQLADDGDDLDVASLELVDNSIRELGFSSSALPAELNELLAQVRHFAEGRGILPQSYKVTNSLLPFHL